MRLFRSPIATQRTPDTEVEAEEQAEITCGG